MKKSTLNAFIGHKYASLSVILFSFTFRTAYALILSDAQSGQDAPSYLLSASRILEDGPFADQTAAPYFPIGYPWFVASIWKIFGVSDDVLGIAQNFLLALSLLAFYKIVDNYFGNKVSLILLLLLCVNPAITASVSLLSYEIPMASFLMLGFYFLHKAFNAPLVPHLFYKNLLASGGFFTIAITFQPKILLSIIVIASIYFIKVANSMRLTRIVLVAAIFMSIIATGPSAAIYRNWKAGDGLGYTQNFATNIVVGMDNSGAHLDFSKCPGSNYDSIQKSACMLFAKLEAPSEGLKIAVHQGVYFWTPYIGNLKFMGTWYHGADWRRLVPKYTWWDTSTIWYGFDRTTGYMWTFGMVVMIIHGFRLSFRKTKTRMDPFIFAIPVGLLWFVSIITYGEPRYRLPILPFYTVFLAISIENIISRIAKRNRNIQSLGSINVK